MSDERRIAERVEPKPGEVKVLNRITGSDVGTIANLSETGFMLVCHELIEVDSIFQLELNYSVHTKPVWLGATCLWNAEAGGASTYWAGFHIIDISAEAEVNLVEMVNKLAL